MSSGLFHLKHNWHIVLHCRVNVSNLKTKTEWSSHFEKYIFWLPFEQWGKAAVLTLLNVKGTYRKGMVSDSSQASGVDKGRKDRTENSATWVLHFNGMFRLVKILVNYEAVGRTFCSNSSFKPFWLCINLSSNFREYSTTEQNYFFWQAPKVNSPFQHGSCNCPPDVKGLDMMPYLENLELVLSEAS